MKYSKIIGTGSALPQKVLTNSDLEKIVETSDEWITKRTGIKQRYIAEGDETVVTLGLKAAEQAIKSAELKNSDIDLIIVATCTPQQIFPSTACLIQAELGAKPCAAFDVQAACSGFVYALSVADMYVKNNMCKNALIIGAETMSKVLDWKDRTTCVLFGDGAGAVVLSASDTPGVYSTHLRSDGSQKDILYLNNAICDSSDVYLRMQGSAVYKMAVKWLANVAEEALAHNGIPAEEIDWVIPHQANIRIIKSTVKSLGISEDKVIVTVDKHANTSGASIPLALDEGIKNGKIKAGQNLLFEAFGGGLTWGSALVRY